jgi:hypothetical protein
MEFAYDSGVGKGGTVTVYLDGPDRRRPHLRHRPSGFSADETHQRQLRHRLTGRRRLPRHRQRLHGQMSCPAITLSFPEIGQRLCVAPQGQDPGHVDLPQARRHLPQPGHPATPGYGPPRGLARSSTCIHEHASPTAVRPLPHPHPRPPRPGLVGLVRRPVPHPGR